MQTAISSAIGKKLALGNDNLLRLAAILDGADEEHLAKSEPGYLQEVFVHPCGTPACAIGHWAAANPKSWTFWCAVPVGLIHGSRWDQASMDFSVDEREYEELFGPFGCGLARSSKDAAAYIRSFVARRQA